MTVQEEKEVRRESMELYGFGPEAMKRTRVCPSCGTATTAEGACPACGAPLPKETLFAMYKQRHLCCPYCDAVLDGPSEFCPQCGRKLK